MGARIVELQEQTAAPKNAAKPVLFLATPCYGCMLTVQYLQCLLQTQIDLANNGIGLILQTVGNESLITRARNLLTKQFLESPGTHLLFIDADISWAPQAILRLLQKNEGVVTTSYPKKFHDWSRLERRLASDADTEPLSQAGLDYNLNVTDRVVQVVDGFAKVLDAATGFMLVKREAIERMYKFYEKELLVVNDLVGARQTIKDYVALFDCMIDPDTRRSLSEDFAFSRRWQKMGEEVYMDLAMPLGHTGSFHFEGDVRLRLMCGEGRKSLQQPLQHDKPDEDQAPSKGDGKQLVLLALMHTADHKVSVGFTMSMTKLVGHLQADSRFNIQVKMFGDKNDACDYMYDKQFDVVVLMDGMLKFEPDIVVDMLCSHSPLEAGVHPAPDIHWDQMKTFEEEPVSCRGLRYPIQLVELEGMVGPDRAEATCADLGLAKIERCVLDRVADRLDPNATFCNGRKRLWFHDGVFEDRRVQPDEMFCKLWGEGVTLNLKHPVTLLANSTFSGVVLARNQIR